MDNKAVETNSQNTTSTALAVSTKKLDEESLEIINKVIDASDSETQKDLTYLFNQNQAKKTMIRQDKLNKLMDIITDQAIDRFTTKPDNMSNQELLQAIKIVQDTMERSQKQIMGAEDKPLIQVNQQNTEVHIDTPDNMPKESRDKIRQFVDSILGSSTASTTEAIEVTAEESKEDEH